MFNKCASILFFSIVIPNSCIIAQPWRYEKISDKKCFFYASDNNLNYAGMQNQVILSDNNLNKYHSFVWQSGESFNYAYFKMDDAYLKTRMMITNKGLIYWMKSGKKSRLLLEDFFRKWL